MTFTPALHPASDSIRSQRWFLFRGDRILIRRSADASVRPFFTDVSFVEAGLMHRQYLGCLNDIDCFTAELSSEAGVSSAAELQPVRQLLGAVDDELAAVAGRANQMIHWARTHQFCGLCGHVTRDAENERAKICPACGLINYPRVSPAIMPAAFCWPARRGEGPVFTASWPDSSNRGKLWRNVSAGRYAKKSVCGLRISVTSAASRGRFQTH